MNPTVCKVETRKSVLVRFGQKVSISSPVAVAIVHTVGISCLDARSVKGHEHILGVARQGVKPSAGQVSLATSLLWRSDTCKQRKREQSGQRQRKRHTQSLAVRIVVRAMSAALRTWRGCSCRQPQTAAWTCPGAAKSWVIWVG